MKLKVNLNAVNQYPKGDIIYKEGESVYSIALVVRGLVLVHHDGAKYSVGAGSFLAVNDVMLGKYQSTYTAMEDLIIYVFAIEHKDDLENILSINKDYNGFLIMSMNKVINELGQIYLEMIKHGSELYGFLTDSYKVYHDSASRLGYEAIKPQWINELSELDSYLEPDLKKISYYKECVGFPIDVVKTFYSHSNVVTMYHLEEQAELINQLNEILKEYAHQLLFMSKCLIDETDSSLFRLVAAHAIEIVNADGNSSELIDNMDIILERINNIKSFFDNKLGMKMKISRKRMEEAYHLLTTGTKDKEMSVQTYLKYSMEDAEKVIAELVNSYQQIIDYSGIDKSKGQSMQENMMDFVNIRDRLSMDGEARNIRKQLTDAYYELYRMVFLKAYNDKNAPRIIDMFLKYGYADERLLTNEQILSLYFLKDEDTLDNFNVYNIKEWLELIYEGKREPSKNEFDQEYSEVLFSMKRRGDLTDQEMSDLLESKDSRLEHEIQNMFRYNNRITSGQITTFVPVLHKDAFLNHLDKSHITPSIVMESMKKLLEVDYSIFDREVLYVNNQKNIDREYIIERVYPDIILMPTAGTNGVMWQEITGKKRSSQGRFLFPVFCETDIFLNMVKVCGRFRWEMCRTIEGTAWNDIKVKSLTSEYTDYLQFYKKNRELSEDRKNKIKLQIQKGRKNSREIFTIDYEAWVNYESRGAIKLNKFVREIMATYCPFSKKIRERFTIQPIFEEAYARYKRERLKKVREIEGRYRLLQRDNIELTKELVDTLNYYKET